MVTGVPTDLRIMVSIRSLHQSTGRYCFAPRNASAAETTVSIRSLQTKVQGDVQDRHTAAAVMMQCCFNPLPAPKYREIGDRHLQYADSDIRVSIRSLHQSTGRYQGGIHDMDARHFSFQSAPCTKVQGDNCIEGNRTMVYMRQVSIRSLHQSTGRYKVRD